MNAYEILNVAPTANQEEIRTAYRELARRWHPDRFMAGPERDWANNRMADINAAYRACLNHVRERRGASSAEDDGLAPVRQLIDVGQYASARRLLMSYDTRCAEWNYLFGIVLAAMRETDKAIIYLTVAAHQNPESAKYAMALKRAQQLNAAKRVSRLFGRRQAF